MWIVWIYSVNNYILVISCYDTRFLYESGLLYIYIHFIHMYVYDIWRTYIWYLCNTYVHTHVYTNK